MGNLMKYNAANLNQFLDLINRNSIGMGDYFDRLTTLPETQSNYPPYNLVQVNTEEFRLELALAGFKKKEINVFTQEGRLFVEGNKEELNSRKRLPPQRREPLLGTILERSFTRSWSLSDETEVGSVVFEDGLLTVTLQKIVPEHHKRKDYL